MILLESILHRIVWRKYILPPSRAQSILTQLTDGQQLVWHSEHKALEASLHQNLH